MNFHWKDGYRLEWTAYEGRMMNRSRHHLRHAVHIAVLRLMQMNWR